MNTDLSEKFCNTFWAAKGSEVVAYSTRNTAVLRLNLRLEDPP